MQARGTAGNERLTASTGVLLIVLLAVLGATIIRIGQLIWLHLFLGLLLMGPVALKMASTGYRFARYYGGDVAYRLKGPPPLWLRFLAPGVVLSTAVVFLSGVVLMFDGPQNRSPMLTVHKASFVVWLGFTAAHVLGHLSGLPGTLRAPAGELPGRAAHGRWEDAGRWIALSGACMGGLVLALALAPDFSAWTAQGALHHHHG